MNPPPEIVEATTERNALIARAILAENEVARERNENAILRMRAAALLWHLPKDTLAGDVQQWADEATAERDVLIARTEKAEAELAEAQTKIYTLHCRIAYLIGLFPNRSDLPDEIKRSDVEAASEREALVARAEKAEAKLASAQKGLQSVVGLFMHTKGVTGILPNGEVAYWVDILPGGKLSDWLRDFDRALNDSQSPQPKHTI